MKIRRLTTTALIAALAFSACTSESDVLNTENKIKAEQPTFVFTFSTPAESPIVIPGTRAANQQYDFGQTQSEAKLYSVWMYEFDSYADTLISAPQNIFRTTNTDGWTSAVDAANNKYSYTYKPGTTFDDSRARRFYFVANEKVSGDDVKPGMRYDAFKVKLANIILAADADGKIDDKLIWTTNTDPNDGLAMTGVGMVDSNPVIPMDKDHITQVKVDLTRVVARIDVLNNTPELTITEIRLVNANDRSYMFPHQKDATTDTPKSPVGEYDYALPTGTQKIDNIRPFTALTEAYIGTQKCTTANGNGFTPTPYDANRVPQNIKSDGSLNNDGAMLRRAFYLYEGVQPAAEKDALHIQIGGVLKGIEVFYNIPFWTTYLKDATDVQKALNQGITVKRNHVYTIEVGDGKPANINTDVKFAIRVNEWNKLDVIDVFDTDVFKYWGNLEGVVYERTNQTMLIPDYEVNAGVHLKVSDDYTNVDIVNVQLLSGEDWLTVKNEAVSAGVDGAPAALTATRNINIKAKANTTGEERSGSFRITYKVGTTKTDEKIVYTVKQSPDFFTYTATIPNATNPISRYEKTERTFYMPAAVHAADNNCTIITPTTPQNIVVTKAEVIDGDGWLTLVRNDNKVQIATTALTSDATNNLGSRTGSFRLTYQIKNGSEVLAEVTGVYYVKQNGTQFEPAIGNPVSGLTYTAATQIFNFPKTDVAESADVKIGVKTDFQAKTKITKVEVVKPTEDADISWLTATKKSDALCVLTAASNTASGAAARNAIVRVTYTDGFDSNKTYTIDYWVVQAK